MSHNVVHFAIHADDVERAQRFYAGVFGWHFEAWGPPGFFRIRTGPPDDPGIEGALHTRQESLEGTGTRGFTCTIRIDDAEATRASIEHRGGKVTIPGFEIPGVGRLIEFIDPEGNVVHAMHYLS